MKLEHSGNADPKSAHAVIAISQDGTILLGVCSRQGPAKAGKLITPVAPNLESAADIYRQNFGIEPAQLGAERLPDAMAGLKTGPGYLGMIALTSEQAEKLAAGEKVTAPFLGSEDPAARETVLAAQKKTMHSVVPQPHIGETAECDDAPTLKDYHSLEHQTNRNVELTRESFCSDGRDVLAECLEAFRLSGRSLATGTTDYLNNASRPAVAALKRTPDEIHRQPAGAPLYPAPISAK